MARGIIKVLMRGLTLTACTLLASPSFAQSSFARQTDMNWDGALTGIFLGLLLFSTFYNLAFFAILRDRFLIWQMSRSATYFLLCIGLSPLAMGPWVTAESEARQILIVILFDLGVIFSGPFLRTYLEPGMISKPLDKLIGIMTGLMPFTTPAMLMADCPPAYMALRNLIMVSALLINVVAVTQALLRGSRVARFQAASWSGLTLVFGISLFHDIVLGRPFEMLLFALFPALGLEAILTAIGISDRLFRLRRDHDQAQAKAEVLQVMAHTDPLTGLANRRSLEEQFETGEPTAFAMLDLDHFKQINDQFGHDVGDQVLVAVAQALCSGGGFAARLGGEEFALLFYSEQAATEAEALRERIPQIVARQVVGLDRPVTASMGFTILKPGCSFETTIKIADISLYQAKSSGRNRIICSQSEGFEIETVAA
jgi:diguanylate cyclase